MKIIIYFRIFSGDPILRLKAQDVPVEKIKSDEIQNVIKQMKKVHRDYNLVGIAAPQIGVSYRIIIIEFREDLVKIYPSDVYRNRQMETLPMTVRIKLAYVIALRYHAF